MKVIIYQTENNEVAICRPTKEILEFATIEEVANKDVPSGTDYWIINEDSIPSDTTFRDAWELDIGSLGNKLGTGVESNEFSGEVLEKIAPSIEKDTVND